MIELRHVLRADIDATEVALADAFADDPMFAWVYPDAARRPVQLRSFFRLALELGIRRGHTYTDTLRRAAAIWSPPDVAMFEESDGELLGRLLHHQLGERAGPTLEGLAMVGSAHPRQSPHFYLFVLGTRPDSQSHGLGGALIRRVVERCDAEGLGAYLESSNVRNVAFYERHDFEVVAEITLPDGPMVRPMWREAR